MYGDLLRRFPFLPPADAAGGTVIALTLLVEAAIPILLTFRRTRHVGVLLGIGFHLMLGLVGHRTFSALAYALYGLLCMDELVQVVALVRRWATARFSKQAQMRMRRAVYFACIVGVAALLAADLTGNFRAGIGPLKVYRVPWVVWILWSCALGAVFALCGWRYDRRPSALAPVSTGVRPGWRWLMLLIIAANGASQYLGFKTETCFTMYSNLRTEGNFNNHLFLPAFRLASYQDDLVEIVSTAECAPCQH